MSVTRLYSLCQYLTHIAGTCGHVFVCEGCGKYFRTDNSMNRHKKLMYGKPGHKKNFRNSLSVERATGSRPPQQDHPQVGREEDHILGMCCYWNNLVCKVLCFVYFFYLGVYKLSL